MQLIYNVKDKPKFKELIVFALQQLLAIMAATIAVPAAVGNGLTASAALVGAGLGTLVYLLLTKFRSPVFLGSSFAFIPSIASAFAGAYANVALGYAGLLIGAIFAGLVYVILALVVKFAGTNWISKVMPPVVIGPTVAIIGLSLAGDAVSQLFNRNGAWDGNLLSYIMDAKSILCILCGLVTLLITILCSTYGKKMMKLIPFVLGILGGYILASLFTVIGSVADIEAMKIIDFSVFGKTMFADGKFTVATIISLPDFVFVNAFKGFGSLTAGYIGTIAAAYIPVGFVVFAEHLADHKNLSSIIGSDLLEDPGLTRTLLGDGIGSMVGTFFGGCPNTTYGESIACVAVTRNASAASIFAAAILAIASGFLTPFVAFLQSIPACVMGGVCMALYGFISVSGLKMLQPVDLGENRNLFTASVILIAGVGNLSLTFGNITFRTAAVALILGIIVNAVLSREKKED